MPLVSFTNGAVADAADVNANFALCLLTDTARTVVVSHDWNAAQDFAAGTVSLPGIYLNGDTDTGLYEIGAGNWGWASAGSKVLDLKAAGLGITGTLTVSSTLTVTGTIVGASWAGNLEPDATGTRALGGSSKRWGTAYVNVLNAASNATIGGTLGVTGNTTLSGTLTTSGTAVIGTTLAWGGGSAIANSNDVLQDGDVVNSGSLAWGGGAAIASSDDIIDNTILSGAFVWDPGSIAAQSNTNTTFTVTGAVVGDGVMVDNPFAALDDGKLVLTAYVSAADTVFVSLYNGSASSVDPGSRTVRPVVIQF